MAKRFRSRLRRRIIITGILSVAGLIAMGKWLGFGTVIADAQAEREAVARGIAAAAEIERRQAIQTPSLPATTSAAPPHRVTVTELFNAYRADREGAGRRFGAVDLDVSGRVLKVTADISGATIQFASPVEGETVAALISREDVPLVASVIEGSEVSFICHQITELKGVPLLGECRF